MDINSTFLLLQINDAYFPIGGYSHSYGLETYIQDGVVHDTDTAAEFILKKLKYNLCYNELAFVKHAWECANNGDLDKLKELDDLAEKRARSLVHVLLRLFLTWILRSLRIYSVIMLMHARVNRHIMLLHMVFYVLLPGFPLRMR